MTDEDFCSYEIAVQLKKLGFDYPCYFYYTKKDAPEECVWHTTSEEAPIDYNRSVYAECSMPTLTQAQKWLRDEWNTHINACVYGDCSEDADGKVVDEWTFWAFDIYNTESGKQIVNDDEEYDTYESALSAGIKSALELITDKTK